MTIHARPDQEIRIQEALQAGIIHSAEDVIDAGLERLRERYSQKDPATKESDARNLVELFANSPFAGLNMDFERDEDTGREIDLRTGNSSIQIFLPSLPGPGPNPL